MRGSTTPDQSISPHLIDVVSSIAYGDNVLCSPNQIWRDLCDSFSDQTAPPPPHSLPQQPLHPFHISKYKETPMRPKAHTASLPTSTTTHEKLIPKTYTRTPGTPSAAISTFLPHFCNSAVMAKVRTVTCGRICTRWRSHHPGGRRKRQTALPNVAPMLLWCSRYPEPHPPSHNCFTHMCVYVCTHT